MIRTILCFAVAVCFYASLVYVFRVDTSTIDRAAVKAVNGTVAVLRTVGK